MDVMDSSYNLPARTWGIIARDLTRMDQVTRGTQRIHAKLFLASLKDFRTSDSI